jgi:branched-chain amino acid transport system permease protein
VSYLLQVLIVINIYIILALSLNLLVGYLGIISLSHSAFFGIGAYSYALVVLNFQWGLIPALIVSVSLTVVLSLLLCIPVLRLRGDYLILATLAFQLILYDVLYNWLSVTRGPFGISGIPSPRIGAVNFDSPASIFVLTAVFVIGITGLLYLLTESPFGRVLRAIREDELATTALGKNTIRFKLTSFGVSAGLAGIAGALLSGFMHYIDPTSFTLNESVFILSIVIIGGVDRFAGPILGAILMVSIPEILRLLYIPDAVAANMRLIIQGVIVLLVLRFRPSSLKAITD